MSQCLFILNFAEVFCLNFIKYKILTKNRMMVVFVSVCVLVIFRTMLHVGLENIVLGTPKRELTIVYKS